MASRRDAGGARDPGREAAIRSLAETAVGTTVSNVAARNGNASARPTTSGTRGARRRARPSASSEGSSPTARVSPLEERADDLVEPRDLLGAAH